MPVILRYKGYKFFFFSNEGDPFEPPHVHTRKGSDVAKFWLNPNVSLANAYGFSSKELSELSNVIEKNKEHIERSWNEHFNR